MLFVGLLFFLCHLCFVLINFSSTAQFTRRSLWAISSISGHLIFQMGIIPLLLVGHYKLRAVFFSTILDLRFTFHSKSGTH